MKFLFVKLRHIGDTLILTPTLQAVRESYPDAQIDVVVRRGCESILRGCGAVNTIYTSAEPEKKKRKKSQFWQQIEQIGDFRKQKYDYAFDMTSGDRSRLIVGLSGAKVRATNLHFHPIPFHLRPLINQTCDFDYREIHQVEKDYRTVASIVDLQVEPSYLRFEESLTEACPLEYQVDDFIVMHTSTRWKRKEWPLERWIVVGKELLTKTNRIFVSVGPSEAEIAFGQSIAEALGDRVVCTAGQLNFAQLAGLLYRARLFVGVDTAVMHLAAACRIPIVALLGPTNEMQWRPWKADQLQLIIAERGENAYAADGSYAPAEVGMEGIEPEVVIEACCRFLQ